MSLIKGIYAASMSVLNDDLTLNITKTIGSISRLLIKLLEWVNGRLSGFKST